RGRVAGRDALPRLRRRLRGDAPVGRRKSYHRRVTPWLALVACKAVLTAQQALPCRSIEFDLTITDDDAFVVSHEPVAGKAADLKGVVGFDEFVDGMKGKRFEFVNVDLKERSLMPGDGRLSRALARHEAAFAKLAAQSGVVVATTPVPTRHLELERFL